MTHDYSTLPEELPAPEHDGAADRLPGRRLPSPALKGSDGGLVDRPQRTGRRAIYVYPMTDTPSVPLPDGWHAMPGARGCTPQSCGFRDHHAELAGLGAGVYGLSTLGLATQREARGRLRRPFEPLSDPSAARAPTLGVPTFEAGGATRDNRLTLAARNARIATVFYPVRPPDRSAAEVLSWLRRHSV